ncbi:MAG TPA: PilZ domain-containing protein [Steroidobacteraceae bacterium]|nr:PilZ domain-containing protein [Steroidobacteraceae bacterium]
MSTMSRNALEVFAREFGDVHARSRVNILVSPGESDKSFPVTVLGVLSARRYLIVSAPTTTDGSLIAVFKGLTLTCRWFNASTAFLFTANITRILFEPEPLLYLRLTDRLSRRAVRNLPRALVKLPAVIKTSDTNSIINCLVVDLSVTGARVALVRDTPMTPGQQLELSVKPRVLEQDFLLRIDCTVMTQAEPAPSAFPEIVFHGVKFNHLEDMDLLVLQSYVQACLLEETDSLAHVLLAADEIVELKE